MILLLKSIYKLITSLTDLVFSLIPISLGALTLAFFHKVSLEINVFFLLIAILIELILIEQKLDKKEKDND